MIEIEEPPDIRACAMGVALVWLWSARSRSWKSYEPVDDDIDLMRRHRCERHGDPNPPWRQLEIQPPGTFERGIALARETVENASKENPS